MGWLIFIGSLIYYSVKGGSPLSAAEVEETARQVKYRNTSFSTYRFRGTTWDRGFTDSFSLAEAKRARKGWWKDPRWRRNLIAGGGGLIMGFGLFGLVGVLGPVGAKVLLGSAMLYAVERLASAFTQA